MPMMTSPLHLAWGSLVVGVVVMALKLAAWWVTGSVALLSDALESSVNLATALAALVAIRVAAQPADANHPFGHHKAEYFSAVLEGVMIIIAALLILREAYDGLRSPVVIETPVLGLAVNTLATLLNLVWAQMLIRQGRAMRSPALSADGRHLMTDVWTSAGVVVGLIGAVLTGWWRLDAVMAALVAVNILWSGLAVMRASIGGLMDEATSAEADAAIRQAIAAEGGGALEAHDLRTRDAGNATFVEFHLVVPGEMSVHDAHDICDRIEAAIEAALPHARVLIHVEPGHMAKNTGVLLG